MEPGVDIDEFVEMVKIQNKNLNLILEQESFLDRVLLMLAAAVAVDCKDWTDPEEAIDICNESISSVSYFAKTTSDRWKESPSILVFAGNLEPDTDDWNNMFMDGQSIFREILGSHIEAYGADQIEHAYKETTLCLTYMIAIGCARSSNIEGAVQFSKDMIRKCYDFINEHCKLVEKKD